jgi:hypothetical protein
MASTGRKNNSFNDKEDDDYVYPVGGYHTTARYVTSPFRISSCL